MQNMLHMVFPPQCVSCRELVTSDFSLCGSCWRDTPFISGLVCDACGVPLPGGDEGGIEYCDDCLSIARPWDRGRAALIYKRNGRGLVLALKHGDRLDLAKPAAQWMLQAAQKLMCDDTVIAPVPAHYIRLVRRRYNQAAELSRELARLTGKPVLPDLLRRVRRTKVQDGMGRDARFANLSGAIHPRKSAKERLRGRPVLLIDDVMTSGATLAAATEACHAAGASKVSVLTLARVAKDA